MEKIRKENGEPDVIEVRQTFNDPLQARLWEEKVIRRMKMVRDEKWLNRSNGGKDFYNEGHPHSEEAKEKIGIASRRKRKPHSELTKKKIGEANRGRTVSEETKEKISKSLKGKKKSHYNRVKPVSEETRKKIGEIHRNKIVSDETKRKLSEFMKMRMSDPEVRKHLSLKSIENRSGYCNNGRRHTEEEKQKMRKPKISNPNTTMLMNGNHPSQMKETCPHCGMICSRSNFSRWHGDKCRNRGDIL